MRLSVPPRFLNPLILILAMALSSCGGGSSSDGAGGPEPGGAGTTTVAGNVSEVVASARLRERTSDRTLLAMVVDWISEPAKAQMDSSDTGTVEGIRVFGGGQITTTDDDGNFVLEDVSPSENFVLNFEFDDGQTIALPIGAVPAGVRVRVVNILLETDQGFAQAEDIEVEQNNDSDDDSVSSGDPPAAD